MGAAGDKTYAIHPALGIARVGNAPADPADASSFYLGAESPYQVPNQGKPYKKAGKVKKQAQRFRIYEFDGGVATREITLGQHDVAAITWTVHLANRKAALHTDQPPGSLSRPLVVPPPCHVSAQAQPPTKGDPHYWPAMTRNAAVPVEQRARLCIDAGPQSVGGDTSVVQLAGMVTLFPAAPAEPVSKAVPLGMLCTEPSSGRLLVFAADGVSEGLSKGHAAFSPLAELADWGNNDNWYDDTADGWVQATISFRDGSRVTLDQPGQRAWVITTVPRYTPDVNCFTTLYDVAASAVQPARGDGRRRPSFANDIYPILRSVAMLQWLSTRGAAGHGNGRGGYYLSEDRMRQVSDNDPAVDSDAFKVRSAIFKRIRDPGADVDPATVQQFMPQVSHDITQNPTHHYDVATVTPLQYAQLGRWRDGDFDADGVPAFVPLDKLELKQQPSALDRATLECTAGTPFYPGIESWRIMRPAELYAGGSPLRLSAATQPGDLTIGNALPWQADFLDCNDIWWPVQRPNEVTRAGQPMQHWVPESWIPDEDDAHYGAMVEGWSRLGFVISRNRGATYEEVEGSTGESGS